MTTTLSLLHEEAKAIASAENIKFNQALQITAKNKGFKSYQALLKSIENDYIDSEKTESGLLEDIKYYTFKNRKILQNILKKMHNFRIKQSEINSFDDPSLNDEEVEKIIEERLEELTEKMIQLNESLASIMLPRYVTFRNDSGPMEPSEHVHIGIYVVEHNSDFVKAYNDIFLTKCDAGILFDYNVDNEDINVIDMEFWEATYEVHNVDNDDEIKYRIDDSYYDLINPIHYIFHY